VCALLDGLAHAHARGVVHRDLKAANVLVRGGDVVLADFGLAWVPRDDQTYVPGGTPTYMAPEQFGDGGHRIGPWTDLFALGCLCWRLIFGTPPWPERGWSAARQAREARPPPPNAPRLAVPERLMTWLLQTLEPRPGDRFLSAADARRAWVSLREVEGSWSPPRLHEQDARTVRTLESAPTQVTGRPAFARNTAVDWRGIEVGGGSPVLALPGFRPVPCVGRADLLDRLWRTLEEVEIRREPVRVRLAGLEGVGRRSLARHFGMLASERGAADVLRITQEGDGSPMDGLGGLVVRALGLRGTCDVSDQVAEVLADRWEDLRPLAQDLAALTGRGGLQRPLEPRARVRTAFRLVRSMARARTVLLVVEDPIDDPHADDDVQMLVEALASVRLPVMVVAVGGPRGAYEALPVPPLSPEARTELAQRLLPLTGPTTAALLSAAGSRPRQIVRLLVEAARRGRLVPEGPAWRLREGSWFVAPTSDAGERLFGLVLDAGDVLPLEIAACLGHRIVGREW
ncbi:MAG: protein kinase, partial [Myxococcales bacterium]|nr:protein kinase [Myxococcales bacterium]